MIRLNWISYLFLPLIVFSALWEGLGWTIAAAVWGALLVGMSALAAREMWLLWLPAEFVLAGVLTHFGMMRWRELLGVTRLEEERLNEELNTVTQELKDLQEIEIGSAHRLTRYQQLRQIANTLNSSFNLEDLFEKITGMTGEIVEKSDLILLYVVNPATLVLELKSVWRRSGSVTVKAKTGDPFDLWVMRQAQPLLVQDPLQDFRFSQDASHELNRPIGSLLAVPMMSEHRLTGVLRVESAQSQILNQEDLRLVRIIGDLASLAVENALLYNRMAQLAITDDLTGLSVRSFFEKWLREELNKAASEEIPLSLLLVDIDHFKGYNDTFGHSAGDKLLKHMARLMKNMCRPGELAARFGGEEFVLVLPSVETQEALSRAESLRVQVQGTHVELRRSLTRATISIGISTYPRDGRTPESLLKAADERLYRAKTLGRNRVCVSTAQ